MMENMIGEVARTMQSDRRAQAARNERLAEALDGQGPDPIGSRIRRRRAAIAKVLVALAMRVAPPVSQGASRPTMVSQ